MSKARQESRQAKRDAGKKISPVAPPAASASQSRSTAEVWTSPAICLILIAITWVVFGQTAHFAFVNFDDESNVSQNPVVARGLSLSAIGWAFTHSQGANWIPLTTISHMLDCQLFGLDPGPHHTHNVLWHCASAVLLFLLLRKMTGNIWCSAFVAAVFAVHPLRAESVAWVSERKDVLSGLLFLLTIGAYVRYAEKQTRARYIAVLLFFTLALLAKSMVATLPCVLLLLDYWPLQRLRNRQDFKRLLVEKSPMFLLAGTVCVVAALMPGLIVPGRTPLLARIGNALISYLIYLRQMVVPVHLAVLYPNPPNGQPLWMVALALLGLAAISAGVLAWRKSQPWLLVGWLWYLGMLFPVIGVIQISDDAAHADRYTYLPEIGLSIAAVWTLASLSARFKINRLILGGVGMSTLSAFAISGIIQTSSWRDSETLWRHALTCTSSNKVARLDLGSTLFKHGNSQEAITQFQSALEIDPDFAMAHNDLGLALTGSGEVEKGIAEYNKALDINSNYSEARNNLGIALCKLGKLDDGIEQYRKAIDANPNYAEALYNLGAALDSKGSVEDALAQYHKALDINPDYADARYNLANGLLKLGRVDDAIAQYNLALQLNPRSAEARFNLGSAYLMRGQFDQAIDDYQQLINLNPGDAAARGYLGVAYAGKGESKKAVDTWQQALDIQPGSLFVLNNLAWVLATSPDASVRDGRKAVALAERANQLSGGVNPQVLHTLAAAYAETGRYQDAATTVQQALSLATQQKNEPLAATLKEELKHYQSGQPMREAK